MSDALTRGGQLPGAVSIIDAEGVQHGASIADLAKRISTGRLFWLDICGVETSIAKEFLVAMRVDDAGIERTLRFGQAGRITISRDGIRITNNLAGLTVFLALGVFLPFVCAALTAIWFPRRGLL